MSDYVTTTLSESATGDRHDLGEILVRSGLLTRERLQEALKVQAQKAKEDSTNAPRLGEILVELGYVTREQVAHEFVHRPDKAANILAPVEAQCEWPRACGYEDVDCFFKVFELAVFGGRKPTRA